MDPTYTHWIHRVGLCGRSLLQQWHKDTNLNNVVRANGRVGGAEITNFWYRLCGIGSLSRGRHCHIFRGLNQSLPYDQQIIKFTSNAVQNASTLFFYVHVTVHRKQFFIILPTICTNFTNLFWHETLHVSDSFSAHHQEFIRAGPGWNCGSILVMLESCLQNLYDINHCWVYSE